MRCNSDVCTESSLKSAFAEHAYDETPPWEVVVSFDHLDRCQVVIIYCNIFLPLLLTILSVYLVPLLTLSCVTVPLPLTP